MILDLKNLPSDTIVLHQIIFDLVEQLTLLREQLTLGKAKHFGKSSEKLNKQIEDLELRIEEIEANEALSNLSQVLTNDGTSEPLAKDRPKRQKLPEHLKRTDVVLNPDPICPSCNGNEFRTIGEDISEVLEYVPSSFKVIRNIRPRCACVNCETIVQAYPASNPIDKGKAGPGLLAHILLQKYCNHLPLYRQSQIYESEGVGIARSTMASWVGQCSRLLKPLVDALRESVFSATEIHGDDTPVKVLEPGLGRTKTGRIWTYVRDGRPHGDITAAPAVCYFYSPDRKGERPASHLKDFRGVLHADAYSGYNNIYVSDDDKEPRVIEAACWAHTRRKFYEVTLANDKASIANAALEQINKIYKVEEEIRGLDPDKRQKRRQEESKDLVYKMFEAWKKFYKDLPKKSSTGKAIAYALSNEAALMRFLDDGRIEIDNNAAERAMRSIAVGRKNWLFAGSDNGGEAAASMYSLIETAKMNDINPWKYLHKVLTIIQDYNATKIADLLPWNLKLE